MDEDKDEAPLKADRDGPLAKEGWHGGATFFEESGGRPASPGGDRSESHQGAGGGDPHLPASEAGAGIIPEDEGPILEDGDHGGEDVHAPASEADTAPLQNEQEGEPQSWPGRSFGSIPPPG